MRIVWYVCMWCVCVRERQRQRQRERGREEGKGRTGKKREKREGIELYVLC